jgi:hypothetical protein
MRITRSLSSLESSSPQSAQVSDQHVSLRVLVEPICAAIGQMYLKAQLSVTRERSNAKVFDLPVLALQVTHVPR